MPLIVRVVSHPRLYIQSFWNKVIESCFGMRVYHAFLLPWVVSRVFRKKQITVVFLVMNIDMWRYDGVYRRLMKISRFRPIIVTAMNPSFPIVKRDQDRMVEWFCSRGYEVVPGYDFERDSWIDFKALSPDIIFYAQPYRGMVAPNFAWRKNLNALICYAPYSYQMSNAKWSWNNLLQNYCWRHYLICEKHRELCEKVSSIKGINVRTVGYCMADELRGLCGSKVADEAWMYDKRKRVIWAPHHSITENEWFKTSSFLDIADAMVEIREKYKSKVIFAFKPHPELLPKLRKFWGDEKADKYFDGWASSENSFMCNGDYRYLFAGSDAMIHCSGSFIVEYLFTCKPVQYVYARERCLPDIGEAGRAALESHYKAHGVDDIITFIDDVVIGGNDTRRSDRKNVIDRYLLSKDGGAFSDNVVHDLMKSLNINE